MLINYIIETNPHCVAHPGLTVTIWDYRICHIGLSRIGPHSSSIWMLYHYEVLLSGLGSVALLDEVCCWIFKCSSHAQCVSLPAACESRCTTLNPFSSTMSPCMLPCFLPSWQWTKPLNCNSSPNKVLSFIRVFTVMVSLHSNRTLRHHISQAGL